MMKMLLGDSVFDFRFQDFCNFFSPPFFSIIRKTVEKFIKNHLPGVPTRRDNLSEKSEYIGAILYTGTKQKTLTHHDSKTYTFGHCSSHSESETECARRDFKN